MTPPIEHLFSIPPEHATTGQLLLILQSMHAQNAVTNRALLALERDFKEYKTEHSDMVQAWKASKSTLRFINYTGKLLITISLVVAAGWAATKGLFGFMEAHK